jgi:signal transduction histidine kinase
MSGCRCGAPSAANQPGAAVRRRVRAHRRRAAGVLARAGRSGRPAGAGGALSGRGARAALFEDYAREPAWPTDRQIKPDAQLVQFVETQLAGAIGSASARVMVASVVRGGRAGLDDVMRILDEASQLRAYSHALEDKSRSLERATAELRAANEQLKSLDRLKDDFMSSVTHELRTPLTSIRALAELMADDPTCRRRSASSSWASSWPRPSAEPAGQPGAGHGQDRVRPCRMAQHRRRSARSWSNRRSQTTPRCSASAAPNWCAAAAGAGATLRADPDR